MPDPVSDKSSTPTVDDMSHYMQATSRLRVENSRLREALSQIKDRADQGVVALEEMRSIARQALDA